MNKSTFVFVAVVALAAAVAIAMPSTTRGAADGGDPLSTHTGGQEAGKEHDEGPYVVPIQAKTGQTLTEPGVQPLDVRNVQVQGGRINPRSKARGKASSTGRIQLDLRNASGDNGSVDDVHVRILRGPSNVYISNVVFEGISGQPENPFTETEAVGGDMKEWKGEPNPQGGGNPNLDHGKKVHVKVDFKQQAGSSPAPGSDPTYGGSQSQEIELGFWWTRSGHAVSNFSRDRMGPDGDVVDIASVFSIDTEPTPVADESTGSFTCPDMTLGETYGGRFEPGSFVLRAPNGFQFQIGQNTNVFAIDENGGNVMPSRFSVSNLRIDSQGNFVFEIGRNQSDTEHIAMIIRGLEIHTDDVLLIGRSVYAGICCAATGGDSVDDFYELLVVVE